METANTYFSLDDFISNNENILNNIPLDATNNLTDIQDLYSWDSMELEHQLQFRPSTNINTLKSIGSTKGNEFKNISPYKEALFENDLYQIISNTPSVASNSSTNEIRIPNEQISGNSGTPSSSPSSTNLITSSNTLPIVLNFDQLVSGSPLPLLEPEYSLNSNNFTKNDDIGSTYTSPTSGQRFDLPLDTGASFTGSSFESPEEQYSPEFSSENNSIASTPVSDNQQANSNNTGSKSKRRSSLDSRLSLQKLGDILKTSSLEETVKVEKFILNIFVKDLGFPLGYKTWIRDTNGKYRDYLLDELYKKVNPTYPTLNKALLETVVKRATYSMMQGRLRKERRAAASGKAGHGKKRKRDSRS